MDVSLTLEAVGGVDCRLPELWQVRSQLYRSRFFAITIIRAHVAAFFKIYKIEAFLDHMHTTAKLCLIFRIFVFYINPLFCQNANLCARILPEMRGIPENFRKSVYVAEISRKCSEFRRYSAKMKKKKG